MKDLYTENYKTLIKETEDDLKKWKNIPCSWIRRINIVKIHILPKTTCWFNVIPTKLAMTFFFTELEQIILKFIWNHKRPRIAKAVLREKNKAGSINFLDVRQYYKATVIKTMWYWHKTHIWSMEQNSQPRNKPIHAQSINHPQRRQECKKEKRQHLRQVVLQKLDSCRQCSMKLEHSLIPYIKINSKWLKDLITDWIA